MTTISEIAALLRNGKSIRQSSEAGGLPITRIETIANRTIDPTRVGFADLNEADCAGWFLQKGDILISHINSTKHLGKCAIYEGIPEAIVHGMNLLNLRVNADKVDPKFAFRMLSSPEFRVQLPKITKNSVNQSSFNISNFKKLKIPLAPLAEQKRIAGILDAADALRAKRRESLARLDTLLQSTFLDLFGDPVTNPMGWSVTSLIDLCDGERGISYGVVQRGQHFQNGVPVVRIRDLIGGRIESEGLIKCDPSITTKYKRTVLKGGELVISIRGTVGRVALIPDEIRLGNITRELALIPLEVDVVRNFVMEVLQSEPIFRRLAEDVKGVAQKGINLRDLRALPIIQPPLALQQQFAAIVESVERQKARQRAHLAELDTLFASLQARAFQGEI